MVEYSTSVQAMQSSSLCKISHDLPPVAPLKTTFNSYSLSNMPDLNSTIYKPVAPINFDKSLVQFWPSRVLTPKHINWDSPNFSNKCAELIEYKLLDRIIKNYNMLIYTDDLFNKFTCQYVQENLDMLYLNQIQNDAHQSIGIVEQIEEITGSDTTQLVTEELKPNIQRLKLDDSDEENDSPSIKILRSKPLNLTFKNVSSTKEFVLSFLKKIIKTLWVGMSVRINHHNADILLSDTGRNLKLIIDRILYEHKFGKPGDLYFMTMETFCVVFSMRLLGSCSI